MLFRGFTLLDSPRDESRRRRLTRPQEERQPPRRPGVFRCRTSNLTTETTDAEEENSPLGGWRVPDVRLTTTPATWPAHCSCTRRGSGRPTMPPSKAQNCCPTAQDHVRQPQRRRRTGRCPSPHGDAHVSATTAQGHGDRCDSSSPSRRCVPAPRSRPPAELLQRGTPPRRCASQRLVIGRTRACGRPWTSPIRFGPPHACADRTARQTFSSWNTANYSTAWTSSPWYSGCHQRDLLF